MKEPNHYQASGTSPPFVAIVYELLNFLSQQTNPVLEGIILKSVRSRNCIKVALIRLLVLDGTVIRTGIGKTRSPFLYALAGPMTPLPAIAQVGTTHVSDSLHPYQPSDAHFRHVKTQKLKELMEALAKLHHFTNVRKFDFSNASVSGEIKSEAMFEFIGIKMASKYVAK